jgi:dTDP-4-dehydrorhamnose 3,5-epimerase
MEFIATELSGVWMIRPSLFQDERGTFRRSFCSDTFASRCIESEALQGNFSENPKAGTLRGFHYQLPPHDEAKTLTCVTGSIFNVVIDLRKESATFLSHQSFVLSADNRYSLHVPRGCANAWITLIDNTIIHYYMSQSFVPEAGRGIRFDDPVFSVEWPLVPKVVSVKDLSYQPFDISQLASED